ncbi:MULTISPECIES: N-acetylmuramate alpha-1-phosphate uridylyltransferase MurU [unclassified Thioalkalivibrio]|uniref:N-acetylmuramate alpha-1-phosphate uridylyltransferase MurU n=1 Tax=unclassified Thioalkalivibrio TaxID=2621013 RepID=UPI00037BCB8A|nr:MULTISPECIES: nucleotidyltransferase family protein [unclassified Thioalkalivibrio]
MRAMILAAGRGERMRPLTDHCPKPLLPARGKPLIRYTLDRLKAAGYEEAVINLAHRGDQIRAALGDHHAGLLIHYSPEPEGALETAGGIRQALDRLGDEPFLVVNGDVWCDHPLTPPETMKAGADRPLAHLVLVPNPEHHAQGDFALDGDRVGLEGGEMLTFSGIGWYDPALFRDLPPGRRALGPLLREAIAAGRVTGERHTGEWRDIGTPERLAALDAELQKR